MKWNAGPTVEVPYGSGHYEPIRHPPLSTVMFRCPTCGAAREVWCNQNADDRICDTRKALYEEVYDRYIRGIQNRTIAVHLSDTLVKKKVEEIIQEVEATVQV